MKTHFHMVVEGLGRYAVPIFTARRATRSPYLVGTGVLFNSRGEVFLITAKHVVDELEDNRIVTGGRAGFIRFSAQMAAYDYTDGKGRDHDICIIRIPPNVSSALHPHYVAIDMHRTAAVADYSKLILYAFVGYPHSKNKPKPKGRVSNIEIKPFFYTVREFVDVSTLPSADKSEDLHVAFCIDFKKAKDVNLEKPVIPSDPHGISGCGVWKLMLDATTGEVATPLLVAIGIEYLESAKAFVATRIRSSLTAIEQLQNRLNKGLEDTGGDSPDPQP